MLAPNESRRRAVGPVRGLPAYVLLQRGLPDRGLEAEGGTQGECKALAAEGRAAAAGAAAK